MSFWLQSIEIGIDIAVAVLDAQTVTLEHGRVPAAAEEAAAGSHVRRDLFVLDGVGNVPIRIEHDLFHLVGDHGRLRFGFADDHARGVDRRPLFDHAQREFRDVDRHVERPEIVGEPAPALHIDENLADARLAADRPRLLALIEQPPCARADGAVGGHAAGRLERADRLAHGLVVFVFVRAGRKVEPLPQKRDLLVFHAEFEDRTGGNDDDVFLDLFDLAASELDQLLPQGLELRLVRLEAPQIAGRVGTDGDRFEHLRRIGQGKRGIEILADAHRLDASAAGVLGIVQHRVAHLRLRIGEPVFGVGIGGVERRGIGQRVIRRAQAVVVGLGDLGHHELGALGRAHSHPPRGGCGRAPRNIRRARPFGPYPRRTWWRRDPGR